MVSSTSCLRNTSEARRPCLDFFWLLQLLVLFIRLSRVIHSFFTDTLIDKNIFCPFFEIGPHMKRALSTATLLVLLISFSFAGTRKPKLVSGPMQGHTTATSTMIWVLVKDASKVTVTLREPKSGKIVALDKSTEGIRSYKRQQPIIFDFKDLAPNTNYVADIVLDGKSVSNDRVVKTFDNNPHADFSFTEGSCAYLPPVGFRWIQPGNNERIYKYAIQIPADFNIWTGDYLYFWRWHYKSDNGMMRKYIHTRQHPKMERYVESRPQYAIWDDHDYGPNDSEGDWKRKDFALDLFKEFWPMPSYGTDSVKGIFSTFKHADSEFFMTDDRYYRTEPFPKDKEAAMLGKGQLKWLEAKLLASTATFKFVVVGSQTLNKTNTHECFQHFPAEVNELMNFINDNRITGIIFLTGDMHYAELIKTERPNAYPLYDFTSSALTSFRFKVSHGHSPMKTNPERVPGTLFDSQNFARVSVTGPAGSRVCKLELFNNHAKLLWSHDISEQELQYPAIKLSEPIQSK